MVRTAEVGQFVNKGRDGVGETGSHLVPAHQQVLHSQSNPLLSGIQRANILMNLPSEVIHNN